MSEYHHAIVIAAKGVAFGDGSYYTQKVKYYIALGDQYLS